MTYLLFNYCYNVTIRAFYFVADLIADLLCATADDDRGDMPL